MTTENKSKKETENRKTYASQDGGARKKQVHFLASEKEFAAIDFNAQEAGLSRSEYIIQSTVYLKKGLSGEVVILLKKALKEVVNLQRELKKIGNNINQIAHKLNAAASKRDDKELLESAKIADEMLADHKKILKQTKDFLDCFPWVFRKGRQ